MGTGKDICLSNHFQVERLADSDCLSVSVTELNQTLENVPWVHIISMD